MTYVYNEETGEITVDETALRAAVVAEFRTALGANFPDDGPDANTVESRWVNAETSSRASILRSNAALANQINPPQSRDIYLDGLGALNIVSRRTQGSRSTVNIIFGGAQGTVISRGSLVTSTDDSTIIFRTTVAGAIDAFSLAIIPTESTIIGAVVAPEGTINALVTPIEGVSAVTQPDDAVPGFDIETDTNDSFSRRRNTSLGLQTVGTLLAQSSTLNNFPGIRDSIIIENNTENAVDLPDTNPTYRIAPKSILVIIQPEENADFSSGGANSIRLATALLARKASGTRWANQSFDQNQEVRNETIRNAITGQSYTVTYFLAETVDIDVLYRAESETLSNIEIQNVVQNAVRTYVEGDIQGQPPVRLGTDISSFELAAAINVADPRILINQIGTNLGSDDSLDFIFTPDLKVIQPYQIARFRSLIQNTLPPTANTPIFTTVLFNKANPSSPATVPAGFRVTTALNTPGISDDNRPTFYVFQEQSIVNGNSLLVTLISYNFSGSIPAGNINEPLDPLPENISGISGSLDVNSALGLVSNVTFNVSNTLNTTFPQGYRVGPPITPGPRVDFFFLSDVKVQDTINFVAAIRSWQSDAANVPANGMAGTGGETVRTDGGQQNLGIGSIASNTAPAPQLP